MNRRQRNILTDFIIVLIVTTVAVVGLINFKDYVNWSESMQAMNQLGRIVLDYRKTNGAIPPETYVNSVKEELKGEVRLGDLRYRARWIDFGAEPNEILAYVEKGYHSFVMHKGYIVLRLDGRVEWMCPEKFEGLLAKQQKLMEIESLKK